MEIERTLQQAPGLLPLPHLSLHVTSSEALPGLGHVCFSTDWGFSKDHEMISETRSNESILLLPLEEAFKRPTAQR